MRTLFLFVFVLPAVIFARNGLQFLSATTGAACQIVEYHDGYLYTGCGTTFRVYRAFSVDSPPFESTFEVRFRSRINDICLHDGHLYICANHDGLSKWDIQVPQHPVKIAEYVPETDDRAVHEVNFCGDSLIVSEATRLSIFTETGNIQSPGFKFRGAIEFPLGKSLVCGGAVKGPLFAAVCTMGGANDGVYIFKLATAELLSFTPFTFTDPEDAIFGIKTDLLHVLGGTRSTHNPFDARGYFCSLDVTDPAAPDVVYADTLRGITGLAIASPMNGANINDTLYIATTAALKPGQNVPDQAYVHVYDAVKPDRVRPLTFLPAGLWHFDVTRGGNRLFIASEWYGIKTLDIKDIFSPIDLGYTLTGGWNTGGDANAENLIVANEGYGFKKYDISDISNPVLVDINHHGTFCHNCVFSTDGNYIFAQYSTGTGFVVFDAETLLPVDSLAQMTGSGNMVVHNDRIYLARNGLTGPVLNIIKVDRNGRVRVEQDHPLAVNDFFVEKEKLYAGNDDGLFVYDVANGHFELLAHDKLTWLNAVEKIAVYEDTVFAFISGAGFNKLVCYGGVSNAGRYVLEKCGSTGLAYGLPQEMSADEHGLYLAYTKHGLFAYDKKNISEIGYARTGLALKGYAERFGVQDLYCKNGRIFLVEYFGQTSIYSNQRQSTLMSPPQKKQHRVPDVFTFFPNPAGDFITVHSPAPAVRVRILNVLGQTVLSRSVIGPPPWMLDTAGLANGTYLIQVLMPDGLLTKKMLIYK